MSHTLRTPALPGRTAASPVRTPARPAADDDEEGLGLAANELLEKLWRVATSMRTALALMIALAALAFIGTMLVQAPTGMADDPEAYRAWLDTVRPKYGGWTNVLDTVGFFSIFSSWWFRGIVAGIVASISACSVNRFRGLWKTAVKPRTRMTATFYGRAPHQGTMDVALDEESALEQVRSVFRSRGYRTVVERDGETIHVYADRFRWAPFGTLMAHLSLILILIGAVVGSTMGFRNSSFAVPVGSKADVGFRTGLMVEAKSFSDSYYANGSPSDYASDLVLYNASGAVVAQKTIRVNQPLNYGDITFYQSFYGPSATVKVTDTAGAVLFQSGVPLLWTTDDGNRRVGRLVVDDPAYTVYVVMPASGKVDSTIRAGQAKFEVYRTGDEATPAAMEVASQGEPIDLVGLRFTFEREQQFTGLIVARDPGQPLVWAGTFLLVAGLFIVFFFPNRRIWARIHRPATGTQVQVGATVRHDATFKPDFQHLIGDLTLALSGPSATQGRG